MVVKYRRLESRLLAALLVALSSSYPTSSAYAASEFNPARDNAAAVKDAQKPLKTVVPSADSKKPPRYVLELKATQTVRPLGEHAVTKVEEPLERIKPDGTATPGEGDGGTTGGDGDDTGVVIERPSLGSLIPLQDNLNPFSLDAKFVERIGLSDALHAALGQNLDIEEGYSRTKVQKYAYLAAASGFLPSVNGGYNLFGVTGSIPGALFGAPAGGAGGGAASSAPKLPSPIQLLTAGFTYNAYQGGRVLFGTLEQKHRSRASHAQLRTNVNDTLLEATKRYYDLLLNEAFLSIRTRAVSISQEQVRINSAQEKAGAATGLDVLQSQAQLASDEQNLIEQQNDRRSAAIQLAHVLNTSFAQDLESREKHLRKRRLIPKSMTVDQLLLLAIDRRPELKQFEELRLAAKRAIVVAGASLQPNVSLGGSVFGIGVGGNNFDNIYTLNLGVKWSLGGLGTTDVANVQRARWEARQAAIQAKKTFLDIFDQVRTAYGDCLASDKRIDRATVQILAAEEELRIAQKRMEAGIGLNIDVLNAQRDLTQASINKSRAVVDFNVAQVQLLHDIGAISVDGILHGLKI